MQGVIVGPVGVTGSIDQVLADGVEADHAHLLDESGVRGNQSGLEGQVVHQLHGHVLFLTAVLAVILGTHDAVSQESVAEGQLRVHQTQPAVHVVLGGNGLVVAPLHAVAQVEGVGQAVLGDVVALAACIFDHVHAVLIGKGAEQAFLHSGEDLELVGVAHIVHIDEAQLGVGQVQHLLVGQLGGGGGSGSCGAGSGGSGAGRRAAAGRQNACSCHSGRACADGLQKAAAADGTISHDEISFLLFRARVPGRNSVALGSYSYNRTTYASCVNITLKLYQYL